MNSKRQLQKLNKININWFPYVHSFLATPFTFILMVQWLKYGQDMNWQLIAEIPTSTAVCDISLLKKTLLIGLALGANISETSVDFISLIFSYLNNAFDLWPVRSLINFSSRPALNNANYWKNNTKRMILIRRYVLKSVRHFFIVLGSWCMFEKLFQKLVPHVSPGFPNTRTRLSNITSKYTIRI